MRDRAVRRPMGGGLLLVAALLVPATAPAHGASPLTFQVTDTTDAGDASPGDGVCDATGAAACTLRAAIDEANARDSGDTIEIAPGTHVVTVASPDDDTNAKGDLDVLVPVTIRGTGVDVILDGGGDGRVLDLRVNGPVTIEDVTIRDGSAPSGAGIRAATATLLTVRRVTFLANAAAPTGPGTANGTGGAIQVGATTAIEDSTFLGNTAVGVDGGTATGGAIGALTPTGGIDLAITGSTFEDNQAGSGAVEGWGVGGAVGVAAADTTITVADSDFIGNGIEGRDGNAHGGGVMAVGEDTLSASITGTTITDGLLQTGGDTAIRGGGVHLRGAHVDASLDGITISGHTLQYNQSRLGGPWGGPELRADGGGLWVQADTGTVDITDSTIAGNRAVSASSLHGDGKSARGGGIGLVGTGSVEFRLSGVTVNDNTVQGAGGDSFDANPPLPPISRSGYGGGLDAELGAAARLIVEDSSFHGNEAIGGRGRMGAAGVGGGIHIHGGTADLQLTATGNSALAGVGYESCAGGKGGGIALQAAVDVLVHDSLLDENLALGYQGRNCTARGGGMWASSPTTVIRRTAFAVNRAEATGASPASGGGIYAGTVNLDQVLLRTNRAIGGSDSGSGHGGAVYASSGGSITNSTLTTNSVGGSVAQTGHAVTTNGDLLLRYSTITSNGPTFASKAGALEAVGGTLTLAANVIQLHQFDCTADGGSFASLGGSVSDGADPDCGFVGSDQTDTDPMVGSQPDQLDHTAVRLLEPGSPAIDAAPACNLGGSVVAVDQIGDPRPVDGDSDGDAACDAGAHEWRPTLVIETPTDGVEGGAAPTVRISLVEPTTAPHGGPRRPAAGAAAPIEVALALTGSATVGADYTVPDVVIPAGQTSVTVALEPVDDGAMEGAETITVNLAPGPHTQFGPGHTLTLLDNDVAAGRLAGDSRIETAVEVSQDSFSSADTVVIARADQYPDALAGAPLAFRLGAPVLLTRTSELPRVVADEIGRLGATSAVVLGGEAAVSAEVAQAIATAGAADVQRIAGPDRFETAARIAAEVVAGASAPPGVYVAEGANANPSRGWPDALSVSPVAALTGRPILLVVADRLPDATADALDDLGPTTATIIGGEAAVSTEVEQAIRATGIDVGRVSGPDRYATSVAVADVGVAAGMDPTRLWVATGLNWPDALVAGSAVARDGGVMLLAHGRSPSGSPAALDWLTPRAGTAQRLTILGGVGAVAAEVVTAIEQALTPS